MNRDDLLRLTAGGNKRCSGADMLIKCKGSQSNHCRLTLGAAFKEKMKSILVMEEGHIPYIIPVGGSNSIGATGYVACAQEICQSPLSKESP